LGLLVVSARLKGFFIAKILNGYQTTVWLDGTGRKNVKDSSDGRKARLNEGD